MSLIARLDAYLDRAPRANATVHEVGPFTVFVSRGGWPYYARPRLGQDLEIRPDDVLAAAAAQRELGVPEAFEWVVQTAPELSGAAAAADLDVVEHPMLVHDPSIVIDAPTWPGDIVVRLLTSDDSVLPAALAVATVGFAAAGTDRGPEGSTERDHSRPDEETVEHARDRLRRGLAVIAVAENSHGPLAVATSHPVGDVTEVVGVATLPEARRRGLGAVVTSALVEHAYAAGIETVMLSAGSEDVVRVYERIGFVRVGSVGSAEPA